MLRFPVPFPIPFRMHASGWVLVLFCFVIGERFAGWPFALPIGASLLASLLLHEVGHMLTATALRVPVMEFGLKLAGAYNRRAYATRRRDEILIAASGPLLNLLLVVPVSYIPHIGGQLAITNFLLGITNLIPLPSSDGLRILRTLRNTHRPEPLTPALNPALPQTR